MVEKTQTILYEKVLYYIHLFYANFHVYFSVIIIVLNYINIYVSLYKYVYTPD